MPVVVEFTPEVFDCVVALLQRCPVTATEKPGLSMTMAALAAGLERWREGQRDAGEAPLPE